MSLMNILGNFLAKRKKPVYKIASNTIKKNKLQLNTNIIFIVMASIALLTSSIFIYYYKVTINSIGSLRTDMIVQVTEDPLTSDSLKDKEDSFYELENIKGVENGQFNK